MYMIIRHRGDRNEASASMFDAMLIITRRRIDHWGCFFYWIMGAARWESWCRARAESTAISLFLVAFKHLPRGGEYGFPIRNFSIRSQTIRTRRTYRVDAAIPFIARRGVAFKNILSCPVNTCARRPSMGIFSHVDPICIAVTYMQICIYALFNPRLRPEIACFSVFTRRLKHEQSAFSLKLKDIVDCNIFCFKSRDPIRRNRSDFDWELLIVGRYCLNIYMYTFMYILLLHLPYDKFFKRIDCKIQKSSNLLSCSQSTRLKHLSYVKCNIILMSYWW